MTAAAASAWMWRTLAASAESVVVYLLSPRTTAVDKRTHYGPVVAGQPLTVVGGMGDDWRCDAACSGMAAQADDLWFASDADGQAAAVAICEACPVRASCLADALGRREKEGIWGGLTARERRLLRSPSSIRVAVPA